MDTERIIWISSLVGVLLLSVIRRGSNRQGLLIGLFGTFMYGFLSMAFKGGFEAGFALLVLFINAGAIAVGGLWWLSARIKKKPQVAALLLLAVALVSGWYTLPLAEHILPDISAWLPGWSSGEDLKVHFIDVGQGDSVLIQAQDKHVLIDGGSRGAGQTVVDYLRNNGVGKLDLVIATHPHEDHIGGLLAVLTEFEVLEIMDPGVIHTSKTFEEYLDLIDSKDIPFTEARAGMSRNLGDGVRIEILHPVNPSSSHLNNASIVARLTYGNVAFLFTGDAESEAEQAMLDRGNLGANVLKVGHHGSRTSSSSAFLNAVRPSFAIISVGSDNRYGHPHQEILDRLGDANVRDYRTDLHGTIVITTEGTSVDIRTAR